MVDIYNHGTARVQSAGMGTPFNWIHLSDVHFGTRGDPCLWPNVKHEVFKDIRKLTEKVGTWDAVFFTGDFAQSGDSKEFDRAACELEELWRNLSVNGQAPVFCAVPGNHDLVRPDPASALATSFRHWWGDEAARAEFWKNPKCDFRIGVESAFENYCNWLKKIQVPQPAIVTGLLPGDFSAVITKANVTVGIVGLNSAFLQLGPGDYQKLLDLHVSQLSGLCEGDPVKWTNSKMLSLLLTHHSTDWLAPTALDHFRQDVYPVGRFYAQLCGHQHESVSYELSHGGGTPRRLRQAPSLFGLEKWNGATPQLRVHGYIAGQFIINGTQGIEKIWPRTSTTAKHGGLRICPDHGYELGEDDCFNRQFEVHIEDEKLAPDSTPPSEVVRANHAKPVVDLQLLEAPPDVSLAMDSLKACPRLKIIAQPHHRYIRQEEQSLVEHALTKDRCVWLQADWGTGKEEFISVAIERFRKDGQNVDAFEIRCDEASDTESLQTLFAQQFGMSLQAFCAYAVPLKSSFLVFQGLYPTLCKGEQFQKLKRIVSAILDYSPNLRIILVSRIRPTENDFQVIELKPLESPDVRVYLTYHPDAFPEIRDPEIIDKLHERSDGLPMHLDRMLRALKVSSLESILEEELDRPQAEQTASEEVPRALVDAVSSIQKSEDKRTRRSFRLLKVLSVLPYGETIESINHFFSNEPFFIDNALQLCDLALLDVVPLQVSSPRITLAQPATGEHRTPKLLKVPRQVRDYVQKLISAEERDEIVDAGAEQFFGRKWREGKIKARELPLEHKEHVSSGPGNEFAIIHHLVQTARERGDAPRLKRALRLGVWYCDDLRDRDRFRDIVMVAHPLLQQVNMSEMPEVWCEIAERYGRALRMLDGKEHEALEFLTLCLEKGSKWLSRDSKATIYTNIALAHEERGNSKEAVAAAEEVKKLGDENSWAYFEADCIIANASLTGDERTARLKALERKARAKGFDTIANNLALTLAHETDCADEEAELLNRVLDSETSGYNNVRAVILKANAIARLGSAIELTGRDINALCRAYSYTHTQRLSGLFDDCHDALWRVLEASGDVSQMLRVFRHSSFVWRVRGEDVKEAEYLKKLSARNPPNEGGTVTRVILIEIKYFWRRIKLIGSNLS